MSDIAADLQQLIQGHVPSACSNGNLGRDVPLGGGGLGMDSVAIVMLLLECEARWGISFPAEELEKGPLTVGRLVDHFQSQQAG
jgi:acyl carrier protein